MHANYFYACVDVRSLCVIRMDRCTAQKTLLNRSCCRVGSDVNKAIKDNDKAKAMNQQSLTFLTRSIRHVHIGITWPMRLNDRARRAAVRPVDCGRVWCVLGEEAYRVHAGAARVAVCRLLVSVLQRSTLPACRRPHAPSAPCSHRRLRPPACRIQVDSIHCEKWPYIHGYFVARFPYLWREFSIL